MSYKIQYSPESAHIYPTTRKRKRMESYKWLGFAVVIAAVVWVRLYGVPDFLIPGDPEITKEAMSVFVDKIRDGTGVKDAATTFCKMILDGAEILY